MRKTLLMLLAFMLSICGWSVNYTISIAVDAPDPDAGWVDIYVEAGDVDEGETDFTADYYTDVSFSVLKGSQVVLTVEEDDTDHYRFVRWSDGNVNRNRTLTGKKSESLTAIFEEIPTYTFSVVAQPSDAAVLFIYAANEAGGDGESYTETQEGDLLYLGVDETFAGYRFLGWYDGEELISETESCPAFTAPATDKTYTAKFEEIPVYEVTVEADPFDGGDVYVWPADGSDPESEGSGAGVSWITVQENTEVYVEAIPNSGYRFLGFFVGENKVYDIEDLNLYVSGDEYYYSFTFVPTEDVTYIARFEQIPTYTVTVEADLYDGGEVYVWPNDGSNPIDGIESSWITVQENTEVYVEAMPYDGYRFLGFFVGENKVYDIEDLNLYVSSGDEYYYSFTFVPTEDITYTAKFEFIPTFTITVEANPEEGGWAEAHAINDADDMDPYDDDNQSVTVRDTKEVNIYAWERIGWKFIGWDDGSEEDDRVFVPTESKNYTALFEKKPGHTFNVWAQSIYTGSAYVTPGNVYVWAINDEDDLEPGDGSDQWLTIREDAEVYMQAVPKSGYRFTGWYSWYENEDGSGYESFFSSKSEVSFVAEESAYYFAKFEQIPANYGVLSISMPEAGGDVSFSSSDVYDGGEDWIMVPIGKKVHLTATPYEDWRFDGWYGAGGGSTELEIDITVTSSNMYIYPGFEINPEDGGYEQIGETDLYSKTLSDAIDIKGVSNDKVYISTYAKSGYKGAIQVNGGVAQYIDPEGTSIDGVYVEAMAIQSGMLARVVYTVTNESAAAATFSLGTYADVMIGGNDHAPIEKITDIEGRTFGVVMKDGEGGQLYISFGMGVAGLSLIDSYWFGSYGYNSDPYQIIGNYDTDIANYMEENGSYDSAMGWCWKNRTIEPGQSLTFSFLVGIGEVVLKPTCSYELTPVNPSTWNNVAATHTMVVEGLYDHSAGIEGRIEYAVEELPSTDEGWTILPVSGTWIPQGSHFSANIDVNFDPSKTIHSIHFRAIDILGNVTNMPTAQYEDISAHELSGIYDKVFDLGKPITQSTLTSTLAAGKYDVAYRNNVNAGTAYIDFNGKFPHSIGHKEYTFTISRAQLEGDIVIIPAHIVYNGNPQTPSWRFTNYSNGYYNLGSGHYSMVEGTDYTTTWTNNTLPGYATLTVKGKGNFKGSLTTNFQIEKIAVQSNMYKVTLPEDALYDGEAHVATLQKKVDGIGDATFKYLVDNVEKEPVDGGTYNVRLSIAESDFYYGINDVAVGSFNIWRMDPEEWAALQAIYAELSTRTWERPWDMSKGEAGAGKFDGLTFTEGHVTELDLSENSLDGNFPLSTLTLPYMTDLNLSHNSLSGNVENGLGATEIAAIAMKSQLVNLHIGDNELEGNIGIFAQALPNLVSLDASTNHIENVYPMLSTKITQLYLNNQIILTPRVIDLPSVAGDYEALLTLVPTVMLYNHAAQSYLPVSSTVVTIKDNLTNPKFEAGVVITDFVNHEWTFACTENKNVFNFTTDDLLYVTNQNTTSRFSAKLNFNDGDADFSGATDVLDLQASINFIFNEFSAVRPFNFTAANLFKDAMINVQDIVLMTELLLADTDSDPLAAPARVKEAAQDAEAELRWENGELHLTSQKDVAALDLIVDADAAIEWLVPTHELVTKQTLNGQHAVIYSFEGNTFAANNDIVIARSKDLMPVTTKAVLADKEAQPISVRRITVDAKVPTGIDSQESVIENRKLLINGVLYIERDGKMYDATGRLVRTQLQ